jgi:transcriptional regulator with XRE-family HTH domain
MIGPRLREARLVKKYTQEELAKLVNTGKTTISNYETGFSRPSPEIMNDLADVLAVSTDYLYGRTDNPTGVAEKNEDKEFQEFVANPKNKHWFKEMSESPEEQLEELRKIWDIIKVREAGRKPGDKQ